ncbi:MULTISPECIES: hypothetical protein [unclassified Pseudomonas]|uniref:hypothetical protein n=1 Tax=unclassified Pseudomonas TaxID=196821 RepID=UPI000BD453C5|nr:MULTISPECIES: hypothetical protein [unclassified Pseudomonas]PVZ19838.1 hypothetical protein F474_00428 [Pseudomonas sp. URIL14HWK12:I12]PVZ26904.1 hypothetical protein F470_00083 [Pseudomonas sp. URIL14HWK12:I10]PVZ37793.1 hypothetical protein F472_00428 [Pseudomonas sp. URIL14HWK12:I11]SNZ05645.1 hypothetical protein SAMN05660463_00976 [Pseudomonas sp. URIL14HWK12:I9]
MANSIAALFLNAVVCADTAHSVCMPAQFVWAAPKSVAERRRASSCEKFAETLNHAQQDKTIFYRCEQQRGA